MGMGEREGVAMGVGERARGLRERERERGEVFGSKMRRVWLVRDKFIF